MMPEPSRVRTNGIELAVRDTGGAGRPMLLLHGFPDSSLLWRHQVPALSAAGHRLIVPDLRGFGASDVPPGTAAYRIDAVLADLLGLLDALGLSADEPIDLVGHDWGAFVGWLFCARHPARVRRFAALSVGHPEAYRRAGTRQKLLGWYILMFQLRGLAERLIAAGDYRFLRRAAPTPDDLARWRRDLARPGRLTAALDWYRANVRAFLSVTVPPVAVPVLGVYSTADMALVEAQMTGSARYVNAPWRYQRLDGVGHWLQIERPDEVNRLLLDWFAEGQR